MPNMTPPTSVGVRDAARIVRKSRSTIQRWLHVGKIRKNRAGLIDVAALLVAAELPPDTPILLAPPTRQRTAYQLLVQLLADQTQLVDRLTVTTHTLEGEIAGLHAALESLAALAQALREQVPPREGMRHP